MDHLNKREMLGVLEVEMDSGNGVVSIAAKWINTNVRPHMPELADKMLELKRLQDEIETIIDREANL